MCYVLCARSDVLMYFLSALRIPDPRRSRNSNHENRLRFVNKFKSLGVVVYWRVVPAWSVRNESQIVVNQLFELSFLELFLCFSILEVKTSILYFPTQKS